MYKLPQSVIDMYLKDPEALEQRKFLWAEIFEHLLRRNRKDKKTRQEFMEESAFETEADYKHFKYRLALEAEPLSEEELKAWREFEKMVSLAVSFWQFPDDEDFKKLLPKV